MAANWLEIAIDTTQDKLDAVTARLTANGAQGLVIESEEEFKTFLEQNRPFWDYVDDALLESMKGVALVKFYVTDDANGQAQKAALTAGLEDCPITVSPLRENDWATSWQKYYKPIAAGEGLYIVPQWERDQPVPDGRTPVYLNPGLTFGTGSHSSTRLCLAGLEKAVTPGCAVLDLGCGSGILSIAALCLGAGRATAVDIDPTAVDVAYENAALNGIGKDRYTVLAGNVLDDPELVAGLKKTRYEVVLANIVADVIIPLSAFAGDFMAENGCFLCSGIIDTRAQEVESALQKNGFVILSRREEKGWVALAARRA